MKVNARGDLLGPGGVVNKSRNQVMDQHYKLHTPMVTTDAQSIMQQQIQAGARPTQGVVRPSAPIPSTPVPNVDPSGFSFEPESEHITQSQLRGSLADIIAKGNQ
jgi:hypothetical protein